MIKSLLGALLVIIILVVIYKAAALFIGGVFLTLLGLALFVIGLICVARLFGVSTP